MRQLKHRLTTGRKWGFNPYLLIAGASLLLLVACSSTPPPTHEISAAEQALTDAEQARVAEYSLPEIQEARAKITASHAAVANEDMDQAKRLAQQASLDIKLASAKAELAKAEAVNSGMSKSTNELKEEMQRNTGDKS
jgi:hypothetical protein